MRRVVIIGAGGFAREVLDVIDAANGVRPSMEPVGWIVDRQYAEPGAVINDLPVLGGFEWLAEHAGEVHAVCGVGAPELRRKLVARARDAGVPFCSVIHPNAVLTRWITLGDGVVITAGCILTNNIRIGDHVHINLDCTIGHDVVIEPFVTLSPGVHVSGNVHLEEGSAVGTGTNIIEKKRIGAWSVVGAGSTVVSDVPANSTVVGVPGKTIKTRADGWHLN